MLGADKLIFNTLKVYPNMIQIIIYTNPINVPEHVRMGKRKTIEDKLANPRSISRTKSVIRDLIICNDFDLFCTFTFNPKRYDRYKLSVCKVVMENWLRNSRFRHSPELSYLVVPELHKDGAIHFHALLKNYNGNLKDTKRTTNYGFKIFNITGWRAGFSTAVPIKDKEKVSNYVSKYITKDMITFANKKRYFCSKGLKRPIRYQNTNFFEKIKNIKPSYSYKNKDAEYLLYDIDELKREYVDKNKLGMISFNHDISNVAQCIFYDATPKYLFSVLLKTQKNRNVGLSNVPSSMFHDDYNIPP